MVAWILVARINANEKQDLRRHVKAAAGRVDMDMCIFGPVRNACLTASTRAGTPGILNRQVRAMTSIDEGLKQFVRDVGAAVGAQGVHGVLYYGHSHSIVLGRMMSVGAFCSIVAALNPVVMAFDSCGTGNMAALTEVMLRAPSVQYVLASPNYHGNRSMLDTAAFFRSILPGPKLYAVRVANEYNAVEKKPGYQCVVAFDMQKMPAAVAAMEQYYKSRGRPGVYDKESRLHRDWPYLYDAARVVRDDEEASKQVQGVVVSNCTACKQISSPSFERRPPGVYAGEFKKTLWHKIMQGAGLY